MAVLDRGFFITFEGGEGAGKSSVMASIARKLQAKKHPLLVTREPGGTPLGERIRELLLTPSQFHHPISAQAELCLFLASRAQHVAESIQPALRKKQLVLCDRFHDSSIVYQGIGRGLGEEEVRQMSLFAANGLEPDLTFYFDIDPSMGLARARHNQPAVAGSRGYDRIEMEDLSFHQKIREAFQCLRNKNPERIHWIDAEQSFEVVEETVFTAILNRIE